MPIYEEKLISPFAIRFTQEHIRTTFKDKRIVEDTVLEIETQPGVGEYDLVLKAPFPHIEIIRWHPPCVGRDGDHWFTLDNRRLYCLQRAAAKHWPKTVAVVVQILYDANHSAWRKYDSSTQGQSVSIAHSCKSAEICRWDWCHAVPNCLGADRAQDVVRRDDAKQLVNDLLETPQEPVLSLMDLARQLGPSLVDRDPSILKIEGSKSGTASTASVVSDQSDTESVSNGNSSGPENIVGNADRNGGGNGTSSAPVRSVRPTKASSANGGTKPSKSYASRDYISHDTWHHKAVANSSFCSSHWNQWDESYYNTADWGYSNMDSTWAYSYADPSLWQPPAHKKVATVNSFHGRNNKVHKPWHSW